MTMEPKLILAAINDIFFYSKLRDALTPNGYKLERVRSAAEVLDKTQRLHPAAFVINMNDEQLDPFETLRMIVGQDGLVRLPVLAFANHEEVDTFRRAKELGVAKIVSRNEFSSRTRELVDSVVQTQPSGSTAREAPPC